ncbi:MAG: amino acid racemase [Candidatus Korarchaeota archaeon]|nr:amino acid racemase [Candidatus Korarchaeota archaeon]NIU85567.1 amino acid racemase [Candidatus Thorarchaeota archaeon]NIW15675.1 amino acid racemase [Candidatus Thorarchaeota archaeon]NIW52614.1 amino acid racemase [Candidatus Korarchaeota archaeon]
MEKEKTLGILGGMGPEATIDFMEKVLNFTQAKKDQDHIRMVVVSDPKTPDRTNAILRGGESPVPWLKKNSRILENAGADLIAIPCNTAHYWLEEIRNSVDIPVLDMVKETAVYLKKRNMKKVGLLSTTATAKLRLYQKQLDFWEVITPKNMKEVMNAIKDVKAGRKKEAEKKLHRLHSELLERGAESVIAGCTEIPLVFPEGAALIDPTAILARKVVKIIK